MPLDTMGDGHGFLGGGFSSLFCFPSPSSSPPLHLLLSLSAAVSDSASLFLTLLSFSLLFTPNSAFLQVLLLLSSGRNLKWHLDQCDFVSLMHIQVGLSGYIGLKLAEHREKELPLQATSEYRRV